MGLRPLLILDVQWQRVGEGRVRIKTIRQVHAFAARGQEVGAVDAGAETSADEAVEAVVGLGCGCDYHHYQPRDRNRARGEDQQVRARKVLTERKRRRSAKPRRRFGLPILRCTTLCYLEWRDRIWNPVPLQGLPAPALRLQSTIHSTPHHPPVLVPVFQGAASGTASASFITPVSDSMTVERRIKSEYRTT